MNARYVIKDFLVSLVMLMLMCMTTYTGLCFGYLMGKMVRGEQTTIALPAYFNK